ncbi:unnamed protein product [Oppiella nova]|uniref:ATP-dependent RNA helicase n=1 Tax=Oppiella nova TaxID=334625 RepID=A0A7R9L7W0_9ACAR|nr:unnamed protein product [Oppiella nova]CAG2158342.1 unnamed protein product [Oppiella nova]
MSNVHKSIQWKSVAIESNDGFTDKDFDGLVAFEELSDYCIQKSDISVKTDPKTKKKCKSKKSNTNQKSENEIQVSEAMDNSDCDETREVSMHLWQNLCIASPILRSLSELSFSRPTPIQSKSIRVAIEDKLDILGAAQTGSGKTLAFGIPLVTHIMNDKSEDGVCKLRALVLTPTRELAIQVKKHLEAITKYCGVSVGVIVGGMSVQKQERILKKVRPDIMVATPGRLWELIEQQSSDHLTRESVTRIKYLVIDEADRMAERGHFKDLVQLMDLLRVKSTGRQTFVFSATLTLTYSLPNRLKMKNKNKANKLNGKQKLAKFVEFFGMRSDAMEVIDLTEQGVGIPESKQLTECKINCMAEEKDLYLYYFLSLFKGRTLVFCNSKDCLRRVVNVLKILDLKPLPLHSSMPQKRRLANLEKFEANSESLLIASDVAARGLDITHVDHVVHYQIPRTAEIYVHRSGRTARAFNTGLSLMLCEPKEEANYYKELSKTIHKGNRLQDFPIDKSVLKALKQRIDLAQKCDQLDHKIRKERSREDWFRVNAKKCEILSDTESESDDAEESSKEVRRFKAMKKQLQFLLKQPVSQTKSLYAHLLKSGSTNWMHSKGTKRAIDVVKDNKSKRVKVKKLKSQEQ